MLLLLQLALSAASLMRLQVLVVPMTALLPLGVVAAGVLELATGIPYATFATAWDSLSGAQRGVVGTVVVLLAIVVFLAIGSGIVAFLTYEPR